MQLNWTDSILSICSEALDVPGAELIKPEFWENAPFDTNSRDYVFSSYLLGTYHVLYKPEDTTLIDALFNYSVKDTTFYEPYYNYSTYCFRLQRFQKSVDFLIKARKISDLEDTTLLSCMGYMYRLSGDPDQSKKSLDLLIHEHPGYAPGYNNRACLAAYQDKFSNSVKDLRLAVRLKPAMNQGFYNLGVVYLKTEKFRKAIDALSTAIQLSPGDADAYYYRGFAKKVSGDLPGSVVDFTKAIELKK